MSETRTHVLAAGMACPLGLRRRPAVAAIRAGISRFGEVAGVRDGAGEPARASRLEALDITLSRTDRAAFFGVHALTDTLAGLEPRLRTIPLFVALPEPVFDEGEPLQAQLLIDQLIAAAAQAPGPIVLSCRPEHRFAHGRAGFFHALQAATTALARGDSQLAIVGAADSLAHEAVVSALARDNRLLGGANKDGIIPGEAAAFVLLASVTAPPAFYAIATIEATALSQQPAFLRDGPLDASGLTSVLSALREHSPGRVDVILSAQPGEALWARQFAVAHLRNAAIIPEPLRHALVGDALGDLGAAAGAVAAAQSIEALEARVLARSLIYGMSDRGFVGGAILKATPPSKAWGSPSTWQFHRRGGGP